MLYKNAHKEKKKEKKVEQPNEQTNKHRPYELDTVTYAQNQHSSWLQAAPVMSLRARSRA